MPTAFTLRLSVRDGAGLPAVAAGAADQLRTISGVDLSTVVTYKLPSKPPAGASGWTVGPGERPGQSTVHDMACRNAPPLASELTTLEALDALERPGARACEVCDAAAILLPALGLGSS
ncbi:hypothetical protein M877_04625 [Streptomyces niveus NCIMB 11891]|nr:hypothetical protein M877_04625 [Streptomyces niveus NCIMB 11891]